MPANLINEQDLKELLDKDIFELIGGENLPQEKKQELYQKMAETIENRVIARIDDRLNDQEREEWAKIIDMGERAKMEDFLRSKDIDVSKMMVEEAMVYKMEIKGLYDKSKSEE